MGWIVSPLKNMLSPKPQFHKMCLIWRADVYRNNQIFKRRSLKWAQIPCDWVLIKREVWTQRKKVKEKVVCVRKQCIYKPRNATASQWAPETGGGKEGIPPGALRGSMALTTPWVGFLGLQDCETKNKYCCFEASSCFGRKLIR